jgi:hypothetical protein
MKTGIKSRGESDRGKISIGKNAPIDTTIFAVKP